MILAAARIPVPSDPRPSSRPARTTAQLDRVLDGTVLLLATWTGVYHVCLVLRLGTTWAVGLALLALVAAAVLTRGSRDDADVGAPTVPSAPVPATAGERAVRVVAVVAAAAAAALLAADLAWTLTAASWLVSAVAGTTWAALRLRRSRPAAHPAPAGSPGPAPDRREVRVVLGWAALLAITSMVVLRPNPDDLFYVNLAQWVAEHGTFPLRDTIFADLVYPMSSWPPIASYDPLVGTVGRLTGMRAATVAYVVVPPLATALSVLALWRLLRAWRVRPAALALSVGLAFLLFDGGSSYASPGNLFVTRLWQGKVILLCLLVPLLLVYALRYVDRPSPGRAAWLFAGGTAAVGLSTTAMFLVPLVAAGGMAPLVRRQPVQALAGFAATAAYPLAAGVVTVAVGGRSADQFDIRRLYRFEPAWFGPEIFLSGAVALIGVAAVLGGALLVPERRARLTTGVLAVITGLTFVPGLTDIAYDLVGLGPTLWRVSWVMTVGALVGVLAARWWEATSGRRRLRVAGPMALVAAVAVFGSPVVTGASGASAKWPHEWQRSPESVDAAERLLQTLEPGSVVLAPEDLAITVDVLTTQVKTVAPRDYFMDHLRDDPRFRFEDRLALVRFANGPRAIDDFPAVARASFALDVDAVCLPPWWDGRLQNLRGEGYHPGPGTDDYTCLYR